MNLLSRCCILLFFVLAAARYALAVEIDAEVVEATDTTAKVRSTSDSPPNIGDPVEICFASPGLNQKVTFASGKVSDVSGGFITVAIEKKTSKVVPGLTARITCTPPQLILCSLTRNGNAELVLVRLDGSEVKQLTNSRFADTRAGWSPDGKRIVFSSRDENGAGLFVMDSDGRNMKRLTHGNDGGGAWSPDGKAIAYYHHLEPTVTRMYLIHLKDIPDAKQATGKSDSPISIENITPLTDGTAFDANPAWSPDGKTIAFSSTRTGNFRLYLMDTDGKNVRDLSQADNPGGNVYPAWSPDGKRIAHTDMTADGTRQIFVRDADGKNKKQLTKDGIFNCYAAWSPDGKKIAYMSFATQSSKGSLAIMNPDGTEQKIICPDQGAGHNGRPTWKPK